MYFSRACAVICACAFSNNEVIVRKALLTLLSMGSRGDMQVPSPCLNLCLRTILNMCPMLQCSFGHGRNLECVALKVCRQLYLSNLYDMEPETTIRMVEASMVLRSLDAEFEILRYVMDTNAGPLITTPPPPHNISLQYRVFVLTDRWLMHCVNRRRFANAVCVLALIKNCCREANGAIVVEIEFSPENESRHRFDNL